MYRIKREDDVISSIKDNVINNQSYCFPSMFLFFLHSASGHNIHLASWQIDYNQPRLSLSIEIYEIIWVLIFLASMRDNDSVKVKGATEHDSGESAAAPEISVDP